MPRNSILLVEDDVVLREMYEERFKQEAFLVVTATTGEEAIEVLQKQPIDLVLLDIMLPKKSGLDVLAWLRSQDKWKTLPVFLLSVLATAEDKMRGEELGATGYLVKSDVTPEAVVAAVTKALHE